MKTILQQTTAEVVGLSTRKQQDRFDEADQEIKEFKEKPSCHNRLLATPDDQAAKAAYKTACSTLKAKLRTMQNDWWITLVERTQRYADIGNTRAFSEALKAIYGPLTSDPSSSTLFRRKYPTDRQGSHPPALVGGFQRPLQHRAGVFTGQDSPSGCEVGA